MVTIYLFNSRNNIKITSEAIVKELVKYIIVHLETVHMRLRALKHSKTGKKNDKQIKGRKN